MNRKDSPQSVIDSYRRRQQMAPYFLGGLALLLVVVGIIILVVWFAGSGRGGAVSPASLFASATPTATNTATPTPVTPTATFTNTPTATITATITLTATPSGPVEYTVQEGDNCWTISVDKKVDFGVLLALNNFGNTCPIKAGDKILLPPPGAQLPTETPLPTGIAKGTKVDHIVQPGETLALIAARYNTTVDSIMKENKITDANKINAGDKLVILVNIVTPTPTRAPSNTPTAGAPSPTATKQP